MGLWDLVNNLLYYLGFYKKNGKLLLLGLDAAGKTTLLNLLKNNQLTQPLPTLYGSSEEMVLGNVKFTTYDVGGHTQIRKVWKDYFFAVDAVVFIIDASGADRFADAKKELDAILENEEIEKCPIVIIGNKIDRYGAVNEQELKDIFGLNGLTTGKTKRNEGFEDKRPLEVFMCSFMNREGYGNAFRWLSQYF